jgi:hypothetical protein
MACDGDLASLRWVFKLAMASSLCRLVPTIVMDEA